MQEDKKYYDPEQHDVYKALCVKQPYADLLTRVAYRDEDGGYHAEKSVVVRSRNTQYRGDILVCSSAKPIIPGRDSGVICGIVELYDVKPISDFTEQDWRESFIAEADRERYHKGFGLMLRNPRRVVEMPTRGQMGFFNIYVPKGDITEYPREMILDTDGWQTIQKRLKKG